jgi:hypothetical protein
MAPIKPKQARIPDELWDALDKEAKRRGTDRTKLMITFLEHGLARGVTPERAREALEQRVATRSPKRDWGPHPRQAALNKSKGM